jgi:hypothetical protein
MYHCVFANCYQLTIYCEAEGRGGYWEDDWNYHWENRFETVPVVWGKTYQGDEQGVNENQNGENQSGEENGEGGNTDNGDNGNQNNENNNVGNQNNENQNGGTNERPIVPVTDPVSAIINQINSFLNIINDITTDIDEEVASSVNIYAHDNTIVVENATDEIHVYDAMGRLICRDVACRVRTELTINGTGVYIVKTGGMVKRVMVN